YPPRWDLPLLALFHSLTLGRLGKAASELHFIHPGGGGLQAFKIQYPPESLDLLTDITCETDCLQAFLATQSLGYSEITADKDLIIKIHQVLQWNWNAEVVLIQRTANNVADFLAKKALHNKVEYVELLEPVYDMHNLLCDVPSISFEIC
ncbi:hypothetical protein PIB30_083235, partial [Stylosanthes scabra]|nr:hypothetical protein [Stylosanthes scabra]